LIRFDYILEQLGKRNIFALLSTIGLEKNIYDICEIFILIQTKKQYPLNSPNFYNIFRIIKGVIEDSNVSIETLSLILMKLNKKEKKETFNLVYFLLSEMKNILANPINQLIFKIIKTDCELDFHKKKSKKQLKSLREKTSKENNIKEDFSKIEIFKVKEEKFIYIFKKLSNISHEYLVNFYSSLPLNENLTEVKIKETTYFEILVKLIKSKNSISIAENYEKVFNYFLNLIYKAGFRDFDKLKIFCALIKFNYKNGKDRLKKSGLKYSTTNIILKFIDEIKIESIILSSLNFVKNKYLKGKKISHKIMNHLITKFLNLKNKIIFENIIQQNLEIIQKKLILNSSDFDLISNDFRRKIEKTSYFLREILLKFIQIEENQDFTNIFELNFMIFLVETIQKLAISKNFDYEGNLEVFLKIIYITSFDNKSYNILLKYFISNSEANKKIKNFLKNMQLLVNSKTNKNNKIDDKEESSDRQIFDNNFFENRFFDINNLNIFDKIEILFYERIKLNKENPNESELTAILIDDSSREKLKKSFLDLFCFCDSANFCLSKKLENLETILEFSNDKYLKKMKKIFLLKKLNNLRSKKDKSKNKIDILDIINSDDYYSTEEDHEIISLKNESQDMKEERVSKHKNKNEILELNLELSPRFKFTLEDIIYIFKAFLFEFETENISFLESLGDLFINDIDITNSKNKDNIIQDENYGNVIQNVPNKKKKENFNKAHLLLLLKSILTTHYFYIKNISFLYNSKSQKMTNKSDSSEKSEINTYKKENNIEFIVSEKTLAEKNINKLSPLYKNNNILTVEMNIFNQISNKISLENSSDLISFIKIQLFSIFQFLKKNLQSKINQEDIVNLLIIITKNLFGVEDEYLKSHLYNFVKRELTDFCFESCENSIKSLADLFIKINKGQNSYYIPENIEFYLKHSYLNLNSLKFLNYMIKLENQNLETKGRLKNSSNDSNNNLDKLREIIFKPDIINHFEKEIKKFLNSFDYKKEILFEDINNIRIRSDISFRFKREINLKYETFKFYMNYLLYLENKPNKQEKEEDELENTTFINEREKSDLKKATYYTKITFDDLNQINNLKKYMKLIFHNIFQLTKTENYFFNVKGNKLIMNENDKYDLFNDDFNNEETEKEEFDCFNISKLNLKDSDIFKRKRITEKDFVMKNNFINQFRILEICKNISLIFLLVDYKQNLDMKNQIRLSNIALNRELIVRSYILKKIEKILLRKNSIYHYLNIIQILILYLNEPNKELSKKGLDIFSKFINFICKKFIQYKQQIDVESKAYFYYYKYIPETYITYLIMYIVFNPNLISLVQLHEKKYFQDLIKKFLKVIKKSTNDNYDSSLLLGILIQIKEIELINPKHKFISLISINNNNTYLDNLIAKNKVSIYNQISNNLCSKISEFMFHYYNQTKNIICDIALDIIKLNFSTKLKYDKIKPLIPIIFYSKDVINKSKLNSHPNNFNMYNLFNNTNNFTFLNGINADTSNINITNSKIFATTDIREEASKSKYSNYAHLKNNQSRFSIDTFVTSNNNHNKKFSEYNDIFGLSSAKANENNNCSNFHKNLRKNNLRKNFKYKMDNDEDEVFDKEELIQDFGNFSFDKNQQKIALKDPVEDEYRPLILEKVSLF